MVPPGHELPDATPVIEDLDAARTLRVDADRRDAAAVRGDAFSLFYLRDGVIGSVSPQVPNTVNTAIGSIQEAVVDHDLRAAANAAATLRTVARQRADLAQR